MVALPRETRAEKISADSRDSRIHPFLFPLIFNVAEKIKKSLQSSSFFILL